MKLFLIFIVGIFAHSNSFANADTVATCGDYQLQQSVYKTYFKGIPHQKNVYQIVEPTGSRLNASIETNSEGAKFKASKVVKIDEENGAVLESEKLFINAMWGKFKLTLTTPDGVKSEYDCVPTK